MSNDILKVENLCASLGDFSLIDINFSLEKGSVMGLIGRNGAGKTTLINASLGFLPKDSGSILFDGMTMYNNEKEVKSKISVVRDELQYHLSYTPVKVAKILSVFYDKFDITLFTGLMARLDLPLNKKLAAFSKGMKTKFSIVIAVSQNPDLIIMDEPTSGLDPVARLDIIDILHEFMQNESKSIIFSTHITNDLEKIADFITMIDKGKIIFSSRTTDIPDKMAICRIEEKYITDTLKKYIIGSRRTSFGIECLISDYKEFMKVSKIENLQFTCPTIEDIMTHQKGRSLD